ncbi:MAG: electron transfer flavoprotein subunit alpha [Rhodospirillaceae bacterium]|nr:electron transfer flavoprotein subunit alpha [Rhodospirillaceae bacterium]|tara:strand:- start:2991 stop:3932 length:942 start_codon:yes stop_codon:yes gene_type:complete
MTSLILAEHDNKNIKAPTLNTIEAAKKFEEDIHVVIIGSNCKSAADGASKIEGVSEVLIVDHDKFSNQLAEDITPIIVNLADKYNFILAPADTFGKNIMPRVAALLDIAQVSDVISIESKDTFVRPIYAGNAFATVKSSDKKIVITVRTTAFESAKASDNTANITNIESSGNNSLSAFVGQELSKSERPELTSARIIISGGRGMQSGDNFPMLEKIADKLGAAVGASRAAVDAGFVPNDYQVGQTGKIVAPDLYIAVGISGAIQHLAGMKDSKVIVAINKDEEAPIFQIADYGVVGDLFKLIPELEKELEINK